MEAAHDVALRAPSPIKCTLIRLDMPGTAVCLTDGGFVLFDAGEGDGAETYLGRHPDYGVLDSVPAISDGDGVNTTRLDLGILPSSDVAVAALSAPSTQGVRVQWWEGAINWTTGALIGEPELKFDGEIDKARFSSGQTWALTLECGTQAERQLEPNADWRLNNAFHQTAWPGELGLIFVDGVARKNEWRSRPENPGLFKRLLKVFSPLLAK